MKGVLGLAIKVELGNKIRRIREEQGLSRGELCQGEEELTVRQLARIEAGESLPTLPKLEFIAERLSVSVSVLVDRKYVELPKRYLQLKQRILKIPTYDEAERVAARDIYLDEIYEKYYEKLPEEEQLVIDAKQASVDVHLSASVVFGKPILSEYFSQILLKENYSLNDLSVINLYFYCIFLEGYDEKTFMHLFDNILRQLNRFLDEELLLMNNVILSAIGVLIQSDRYDRLLEATQASRVVMKINQEFIRKSVIDMVEGKYYLLFENNIVKAKEKYIEGAQFAALQGDDTLSRKIMKEWETDLVILEK